MCERTNTSYYDCPVKAFSEKLVEGTFTMGVAVHNPSNVEMKKIEISVPGGTYRAKWFNISSGFLELNANVTKRCYHDYVEVNKVKTTVENCKLLIDVVVPPRGHALIYVLCDSLGSHEELEDVFGINNKP